MYEDKYESTQKMCIYVCVWYIYIWKCVYMFVYGIYICIYIDESICYIDTYLCMKININLYRNTSTLTNECAYTRHHYGRICVCLYVWMFKFVNMMYTYIYKYEAKYIYIQTNIHTHMNSHKASLWTCPRKNSYGIQYIHIQIHVCKYTYIHIYIHICIYMYMYVYKYIYTCMYINTYMHVLMYI